MANGESFGARYLALGSPQERLELETAEGRRGAFAELDRILDGVILSALHGQRVVEVAGQRREADLHVSVASEADLAVLDEQLSAPRQQERGAWYIPKSRTLAIGDIHLAHWGQTQPRYVLTLAREERATAPLLSAHAVATWAALEPIFEALTAPLRLRSGHPPARSRKDEDPHQLASDWKLNVEPVYRAFGIGVEALAAFGPATGWEKLDAAGVIGRRQALLDAWAHADIESVRRLRTYRIGQLVARYYSKAKDGRALRKRVMNDRASERVLSAYFGGDWLALLDYLGEEPHADEELTRALPKPKLLATSTERAETVAAEHGIPAEEVERILAAYWRQAEPTSPIELRVRALERVWSESDAIHARQASGMKSLFGLLGTGYVGFGEPAGSGYRDDVFTPALLQELRRLWGTTLNPRFPERLITEPYWQSAAARALGPALEFWQAVAINAWGICEGGRAHSELAEFEEYLSRRTASLAATGFPASSALFADLLASERKLGPVREVWESVSREQHELYSVEIRAGGETRREGFEILRDVITRHRRAWADAHLTDYLQARWRTELQAAGEAYHRSAADKAKPPTVKQFAKMASTAAAHWFGGDLTAVYGVLGLKSPVATPAYERLLPHDVRAFKKCARARLEAAARPAGGDRSSAEQRNRLSWLTEHAVRWVGLSEALGQPPGLSQFGSHDFKFQSVYLTEDADAAWGMYCNAIQAALADTPEPSVSAEAREDGTGALASSAASGSRGDELAMAAAQAVPTNSSGASAGSEPQQRRGLLRRILGR